MTARKGNKAANQLIEYALSLGYTAHNTNSGHLKFLRDGCKPLFSSSTFSDNRGLLNAKADLRRRIAEQN